MAQCSQCMSEISDGIGFDATINAGETLCGPCYFGLWGPIGKDELSPASEEKRPQSRRPKTKTVWIPGPTGELAPPRRPRPG